MNKQKKTNTLGSYHLKLLKDDVTWDGVQNICNVYLKHLQLKWAYKVARILCTIIPQLFLTINLNWYSDKWKTKCIMKF